jgi:hypothetical protein
LIADTPEKMIFSQHTNILAILTDAIRPEKQKILMDKILGDSSLIQTTIYYKFYLIEALKKAGLGDRYISLLGPWREMLDKGLTTFEEGDYDERSDCHAWGSSPNYHFLSLVCGITPDSPGFKSLRIEPKLGNLTFLHAYMPHPLGTIRIDLRRSGATGLQGSVNLPENVHGTFIWEGRSVKLFPGKQNIVL